MRAAGLPARVRRERVLALWRAGQPTTEIAGAVGLKEAAVCRIIEADEQKRGEGKHE